MQVEALAQAGVKAAAGDRGEAYFQNKIARRRWIHGLPPDPDEPVQVALHNAAGTDRDSYWRFDRVSMAICYPKGGGELATLESLDPSTGTAVGPLEVLPPTLVVRAIGTNFSSEHVVMLGGVAQATAFVSETELSATFNTLASVPGAVPVTVIGPYGHETDPVTFTFTAPAPPEE